ncbi:MAG: hypothetical protein GOV15_04085, partial [Candidatus Diapherotrites archaeon]|nr:hypothetical protein [Candidatus Diapherotrites archaeon]
VYTLSDEKMIIDFGLDDVKTGDRIKVWFKPEESSYLLTAPQPTESIVSSPYESTWSFYFPIKENKDYLKLRLGAWKVEVYINNVLAFTDKFLLTE